MGLDRTYTLLYPEGIFLDNELYERARYALMAADVSDETLALDVIAAVGPGGHYLAEEHTRRHMKTALKRGLEHDLAARALPRPARGRPREGGVGAREPSPGAAGAPRSSAS